MERTRINNNAILVSVLQNNEYSKISDLAHKID